MNRLCFLVVTCACGASALASDPYATTVLNYAQGSNAVSGYTNPATALGEPTRFTGVGVFPSAVTPFNPPFMASEVVSIGEGGSITLAFDHAISNDPSHFFGMDLLIFGNAFYIDSNWPAGTVGGFFGGGGLIEVSSDLDTWVPIPGTPALGQFPTLGYSDLTDPYATEPGSTPSDFTRPVDPSFNPTGLSFAQLVAGYNGSGGGTGIDIAAAGLSSISYLRISNPIGSGGAIAIDGVAAVAPTPGVAVVFAGMAALAVRQRTRR